MLFRPYLPESSGSCRNMDDWPAAEFRLLGPGQSEASVKTDSLASARSSFFLSRRARPPCRRSRPLMPLKVVLFGPGLGGRLKLYKLIGALGSVGRELLEADDCGRWSSSLSLSLCFWRDRKWCFFSFSLLSFSMGVSSGRIVADDEFPRL